MTIELFPQAAEATPGTTLEEFETWLGLLLEAQRDVLWQIGDLALAVERQHPTTFHQAYHEWASPGLIDRCKGVSAAYRPEDRLIAATWTIHMKHAKAPDRIALVQASVDAGQTSDENRKSPAPIPEPVKEPDSVQPATPAAVTPEPAATVPKSDKWLLAIDLSYFVRATFSMAGIDTATSVEASTVRLIKRLKASNNLTDVVCCLDSANSFRKDLTKDWEHPYKFSRVEKEQELNDQLRNTIELLTKRNVPCVSVDGFEADDVMASYAVKFDGKVTLYTKDKDLRQCLSDRCNMLTEVTWETHPETGAPVPKYEFVTSKSHVEKGLTYQSGHVDGITPALWPHFQAIAGDSGDNIKGAVGIGPAIAVKLIREYKTVQGVIAACKDKTADLSDKKLLAILDFEPFAETTLKLTTMVNTLNVPMITTIAIKD